MVWFNCGEWLKIAVCHFMGISLIQICKGPVEPKGRLTFGIGNQSIDP